MTRVLDDPGCFPYFIMMNGAPAGMLRLDRQADPSGRHFELSILLSPDSYGQGVAAAALRLIRQLEINAVFMAEIHPDNEASQVLFERAGFKRVHEKWFRQDPH
jgi:RimJ/RimL family protein N-acetyltransferase